jgi:Secretion system C-terminal sorting domain/Heparinase II/III-like protein
MRKFYVLILIFYSCIDAMAQSVPQPWMPLGADTTYPRSIIHTTEIASLKTSLASGKNIDLYTEVYNNALSTPPIGNDINGDKQARASLAKNAAFCFLLGVKPNGNSTIALTPTEKSTLKTTAKTLLEQLNAYVNILSTDSPTNFDTWQFTSKQIIDYACAYDLLRGGGATEAELVIAKNALKTFTGNLYYQSTKTDLGASFFQGAKNNHALMTAGAIGMSAIILSNLQDTNPIYQPTNWINCAMWNIHNVMWWDIKCQSSFSSNSGYAEGTYYFKYGFCNLLPFFRAIGFYLKDTVISYEFNDINRKIRNPWYDVNYTKIYDWFEAIRLPDGRMPAIEDTYVYASFPELAILRNPKYVWPLTLSQLDAVQSNSLSLQLRFVYDMRANYIAANVTVNPFKDSLFKVLPDAGIAVFRSGWDSAATYFALTGKNGTALSSAEAHNQADDGSFLMMVNGQTMALSPGYLSYEWRDSVASALSHNMLLVNEFGPLQGYPGKSNGANCYIEKTFSSDVQNYAELRTHYLNTDINRKVIFVRNKYFLMADHMSSDSAHQFSFLLHGYGLETGDNNNTGIFKDMLSNHRAYWKRRNSGLYSIINSDAPISFNKLIGIHEYKFQTTQKHTFIDVKTSPVNATTFLTCLQPFKNIATDTTQVFTLNIPSTVTYKIIDGLYSDVAVSKSGNNFIAIPKTTTGLSYDYHTDAKFFMSTEKSGNVVDLFMQKGTALIQNTDTLISSSYPINIEYIKTGAKTYKGFCGDTGWINFHTGEYPIMFSSTGVWFVNYNTATKIASVYFAKAASFSIVLDNNRIGINEVYDAKDFMKVFPNPANNTLTISLRISQSEDLTVSLYDLSGRQVLSEKIGAFSNQVTMDVSLLNNGMYYAVVSDDKGNKSATAKVCIIK